MRWARVAVALAAFLMLLTTAAAAGDVNGRGSLGAAIGGMRWTADDRTSTDAQIRPLMQAVFRYAFSPNIEGQIQSGVGWNSYALHGDTVTVVSATNVGLNYRFNPGAQVVYRAGLGGGVYVWRVQDKGKKSYFINEAEGMVVAREGTDFGMYGEIGFDRFMAEHITVSVDLAYHKLFSKNDDLKDGYGDSDAFAAFRLGIHYYFPLAQ
jgi:hypothetical protein